MAQQSGRLLSLDVMRGITIAGMILVNNPGSWKYVYTPLEHARWNGLTPTDLVFPFFMFIMGVSMFFSLRKYNFKLSKESVTKVLRRTVLIPRGIRAESVRACLLQWIYRFPEFTYPWGDAKVGAGIWLRLVDRISD